MNNKEAQQLSEVVAELQTQLNRLDRLTAASLQVGSSEDLQVIRLLLSSGPLRVGELASRRCTSVATLSARLERLERRGLVVRERPPGDRRAVLATPTENGAEAAKASRRLRTKSLRHLQDGFPLEELEALVGAIQERTELPIKL